MKQAEKQKQQEIDRDQPTNGVRHTTIYRPPSGELPETDGERERGKKEKKNTHNHDRDNWMMLQVQEHSKQDHCNIVVSSVSAVAVAPRTSKRSVANSDWNRTEHIHSNMYVLMCVATASVHFDNIQAYQQTTIHMSCTCTNKLCSTTNTEEKQIQYLCKKLSQIEAVCLRQLQCVHE